MKKLLVITSTLLFVLACTNPKEEGETLTDNHFTAVPMPGTLITGNPFPTDSNTINQWVANSSQVNNLETNRDIINHGWAIWAALTEITEQVSNGQQLRRFETWYTPSDIINAYSMRKQNPTAKLSHVKRNTGTLKKPNQFHASPNTKSIALEDAGVVGFVKYDPSAAEHIYQDKLFYTSTLNALIKQNEIAKIPNFPTSGVSLKPVFAALTKPNAQGLYTFPSWPGNGGNPDRPFGPNAWNNDVFITLDGPTDPSNRIYSVNDFVNFKMDSAQAASLNGKAGDYAVLQGMHITTREITRWTWQTVWWSENPNTPHSPSSSEIAGLRPDGSLDQGSGHYAMAIAYNMVQPAQPYSGGSGANATSLYAFNPYLEAGFDTSTFDAGNDSVRAYYPASVQKVGNMINEYGMQTNCMSCHGQARYFKGSTQGSVYYLTDQYFPLDADYFKNAVTLDFAWSIQGNIINDNEEPVK